ncbi:MAG TPA: hypothetical protein VFV38_33135 [Ktedonobacteraceae bacterium]|nr:hypothetical protein [Ktedonobacteraceae bacterium]
MRTMYPVPPGPPEQIVYDTQRIRAVGHQIVLDAGSAQIAHDDYVGDPFRNTDTAFQKYINTAPPATNGYPTIKNFLVRHARRIGQRNGSSRNVGSYDWQVQMGNTLKFIAAGIEEQENNWANSFKGKVPR